jgi:hypothetical protein
VWSLCSVEPKSVWPNTWRWWRRGVCLLCIYITPSSGSTFRNARITNLKPRGMFLRNNFCDILKFQDSISNFMKWVSFLVFVLKIGICTRTRTRIHAVCRLYKLCCRPEVKSWCLTFKKEIIQNRINILVAVL